MSNFVCLSLTNIQIRLSLGRRKNVIFLTPIRIGFRNVVKHVFVYFQRGVHVPSFTSLTSVGTKIWLSFEREKPTPLKSRISRNVRTPVCLFSTSSSYVQSPTSVNIKIRLNCFKKMLSSSRYPFGIQTSFLRHKTSILSTFQISDCS